MWIVERLRGLPLRWLLLVSVVLVGAVISGATLHFVQTQKAELVEEERTSVNTTVTQLAKDLEYRLEDQKDTLVVAARNPAYSAFGTAEQSWTMNSFIEETKYEGLSVIAANGTMVNIRGVGEETRRDLVGQDFGDRPYFKRAIEGETFVSRPFTAESGNYIVVISTPVERNGSVVGTLNGAFHLTESAYFRGIEAFLDPTTAVEVRASQDEVLYESSPEDFRAQFSERAVVESTGWAVEISKSRTAYRSLLDPMNRLQWVLLILVILPLAGLTALTYRTNVTQTERLVDAFSALEERDYSAGVEPRGPPEWREIWRSFKSLSGTLRDREHRLERYQDLFNNLPIGVYRNTPGEEGSFVEVNPAMVEIFEAGSREELMEASVSDLYRDPEERKEFSDDLEETGEIRDRELQLRTLKGRPITCNLYAVERQDEEGRTYFDGIVQDVTHRKRMEEKEERIQEKLDVLDRLLRHNLRNDLNVIEGDAALLMERLSGEERERVEELLDTAEEIHSKIEKGRFIHRAEKAARERHAMNLSSSVERVVKETRERYPEARMETEIEPEISAEVAKGFEEALKELLENSIIHNDRDEPEVDVGLRREGDEVVLEVSDDGPGIPIGEVQPIEAGEETPLAHTSGIGLWIVKWYVEASDGRLEVEENRPAGTTVRLRIPLQR